MSILWEHETAVLFQKLLDRIPIFMRPIAKDKITKKAESLAHAAARSTINTKDMIDAFFSETPFGFHGPMKSDMDDLKIDYQQYGHQ